MRVAKSSVADIPSDEVGICLNRILASKAFANADRMQGFLTYVVREALEGRGQEIRAKTIAQDVYHRTATSDGDPENVVRVDARRLRRRLDDYYTEDGNGDRVRIHIDSGGYAPRFELLHKVEETPIRVRQFKRAPIGNTFVYAIAGGTLFTLAAVAFFLGIWTGTVSVPPSGKQPAGHSQAKRQATLEKSHTALQAVNLAGQARQMIFPVFDFERQKLTSEMFRQVIRLDSEYSDGYAGAAQTLATLAILSPAGEQKDSYIGEARTLSETAMSLNPTNAWTQLSAAWVAFAEKDYDRAKRLSAQARTLNANDGMISDFYAVILLFTGDFSGGQVSAETSLRKASPDQRLGSNNVYAASSFHLGEYQKTIEFMDKTALMGGPISPPTLAYQAAARHALGDQEGARADVKTLMETWPKFRIDKILTAFFQKPEHANDVVDRLVELGWTAGKP